MALGCRGACTTDVAKTKVLISCAVAVQLICIFDSAYAESSFSHDTAHLTVLSETSCITLLHATSVSYKHNYEARHQKIGFFAYAKTKTQFSFAAAAKLISAFVFATWIVQALYFLNHKL